MSTTRMDIVCELSNLI